MHCKLCPATKRSNNEFHHLCGQVDVAVITIIEAEREAALEIMQLEDRQHHKLFNDHPFHYGTLKDVADNELKIAIFCVGDQGNPATATLTAIIQLMLMPRLSVLIGISAGVKEVVKIGDLLIPQHIVDFSFVVAKQLQEAKTLPRHKHYYVKGLASTILNTSLTENDQLIAIGRRNKYLHARKIRQTNVHDVDKITIFPRQGDSKEGEWIDFLNEHVADLSKIRRIDGILASSNTLLKDHEVLENLKKKHYDQLRGADMEAAGFAEACEKCHSAWMIVRGVADFGDKMKSDDFHAYASANAAAYLGTFLTSNGNAKTILSIASDADQFIQERRADLDNRVIAVLEAIASSFQLLMDIKVNIGMYWKGVARFKDEMFDGVFRDMRMRIERYTDARQPLKFHAYYPGTNVYVARCAYDPGYNGGFEPIDRPGNRQKWVCVSAIYNVHNEKVGVICCAGFSDEVYKRSEAIKLLVGDAGSLIQSIISTRGESLYGRRDIELDRAPRTQIVRS